MSMVQMRGGGRGVAGRGATGRGATGGIGVVAAVATAASAVT